MTFIGAVTDLRLGLVGVPQVGRGLGVGLAVAILRVLADVREPLVVEDQLAQRHLGTKIQWGMCYIMLINNIHLH